MDIRRIDIRGAQDQEFRAIECRRLRVRSSGSGSAILEGRVEELDLSVSGSGVVDARDLEASTVTISASGSAEIYARADQEFRLEASGSVRIHLFGVGQLTEQVVSGSVKVSRQRSTSDWHGVSLGSTEGLL